MDVKDKALTDDEWWKFIRKAEGVAGQGPLTGLPLAQLHPSRSELVRVRDLVAFWLMGHCGIRVGELVKLAWQEVWADGAPVSRIHVIESVGKGGFARLLPVDSFVSAALARLRCVANSVLGSVDFRFVLGCGPDWRAIGVRVLQRKCSELGSDAIGRSVGCHELRHTFAVRVRRRADLAVLQRLLGHRHLSSTAVYAGVTAHELDMAVAGLGSSTE